MHRPPVRRLLVLALGLGLGLVPAGASASGTGGASPDAGPARPARTTGGAGYGARMAAPPLALRFAASPARVRADRRPVLVLRLDAPGSRTVLARLTLARVGGPVRTVALGRVAVGRTVRVRWPAGAPLRAGRYRLVLHARGRGGRVLARRAGARGVATLRVFAAPKPKPAPAPEVAPVGPSAPTAATTPGVFPVAGSAWSFGDGLGAARDGHTHQGADVLAPEGTPVLAPTAGTITSVAYQPRGAGRYVVQQAADGRAFFFAHCRTNTIAVVEGQAVVPGTRICGVGHTGDASGPHLHFEIWVNGWRTGPTSTFVDPMPQLRAWARR